jgi:hypothetical protein
MEINRQKKTVKYAYWLALSVSVIVIFSIYFWGRTSPYKDQLYAVASSLIASVCFAVIYNQLANREFLELVKSEMSNDSKLLSQAVIEHIQRNHLAHNPSTVYGATITPDNSFNIDMAEDLRTSSFYFVKTTSAKYVSARVKHSKHSLMLIKLLIFDPCDPPSVKLRARDRSTNPGYVGRTLDELCEDIKWEIYASVIALFDVRYLCPIEIAYGQNTSVVRAEIFDNALYLSFYHSDNASIANFPVAFRYVKGSINYNIYYLSSQREFEASVKRVTFDSKSDETVLRRHLSELGMPNPDDETINRIRRDYEKFSNEFGSQLSRLEQG